LTEKKAEIIRTAVEKSIKTDKSENIKIQVNKNGLNNN
jgi:hypothetical protein